MATVALSSKSVGSVVKIKVNGTLTNFIVLKHGYPSSSNGRTLLIAEAIYTTSTFGSSQTYSSSTVDTYCNSTFLNLIDSTIRSQIANVSISSNGSTLSRKCFLLSYTEVGFSGSSYAKTEGSAISYFSSDSKRIAKYNGSADYWWLRSASTGNALYVWCVGSGGAASYYYYAGSYGVRPAFTLPSSLYVSDDGSVTTNTAPSTPSSITVPEEIHGGDTITVEWGTSTDAESNLSGYKVEKSTDGGSGWNQIYQGSATSTTDTVETGTETVLYRVKAYDSGGLESSYKTSAQVTVINNVAPGAPSSITVPTAIQGGGTTLISWGSATDEDGNLSGYKLERSVNGGEYETIYSGTALSYTDSITKGWSTVAYRVSAYDSYGAASGTVSSGERTVINNTAPSITLSGRSSGDDLGTKTGGFSQSYTVTDPDSGDTITVIEAVDGVNKRSYTATSGKSYSFDVTGSYFQQVLNGSHTMTVTANDGTASSKASLTFTKYVDHAEISLKAALTADDTIQLCTISIKGSIPDDAEMTMLVTNNALDDAPVWEDATGAMKRGINHVFTNETAEKGAAFNFKLSVKRGDSGEGGYITSIYGAFE